MRSKASSVRFKRGLNSLYSLTLWALEGLYEASRGLRERFTGSFTDILLENGGFYGTERFEEVV